MIKSKYFNYLVICDEFLIEELGFTIFNFVESLDVKNKTLTKLTVITSPSLIEYVHGKLSFLQGKIASLRILSSKNEGLFKGMNHLSSFAYLRFFVCEYFEEDVSEVLYFDVDCWVKKDLTHLFSIELNSCLACGVLEFSSDIEKRRLGLSVSDYYVNTGVLLINVQKWREEKIQSKLIECYNENFDKLLWADQDVMNILFRGRWLLLDSKYNSLRQFQYDPYVIHFNTSSKPWHFGDDNKWSRSYMNNRIYFEKDWLPINTSFKTIFKSFNKNTADYYFHFRFTIKCLVLLIKKKNFINKKKIEKRK